MILLKFQKIIFTNQYSNDRKSTKTTKSFICVQENIDFLIVDFDEYVKECAPVCKKVMLFDQPWNRTSTLPENGVRVKSWKEIPALMNKLL